MSSIAGGLYQPSRHADLSAAPLSDDDARAALAELGSRLQTAVTNHGDGALPDLYDGLAGALVALHHLQAAGFSTSVDVHAAAATLIEADRPRREGADDGAATSFLVGPAGVLFAGATVGVPHADEALVHLLAAAEGRGPMELLYGPPGRAIAAAARFRVTGDERFAAAYRTTMEPVLTRKRVLDRQVLGGEVRSYLGAAHGVAGVALALLAGQGLWPGPELDDTLGHTLEILARTAERTAERAGWPVEPGGPHLVQWCHGAPGVMVCLQSLPVGRHPLVDEVLNGGARLVIAAGPLTKGPGFCHGTAGNALALLGQARRAGGASLEREARRLMAVALAQLRQAPGPHRPADELNLFEGPPGVAMCLLSLIGARPITAPGLEALFVAAEAA